MTDATSQPPATCPRCGRGFLFKHASGEVYECGSRLPRDGQWVHGRCCDAAIGKQLLPLNAATLSIAERQRMVVAYAKRLGLAKAVVGFIGGDPYEPGIYGGDDAAKSMAWDGAAVKAYPIVHLGEEVFIAGNSEAAEVFDTKAEAEAHFAANAKEGANE